MDPELYRKLRRIEVPGDGRFLTFSCYRQLPLLSNDKIKQALVERIAKVKAKTGFRLYAWVIMPDHVHMIVQTGRKELTTTKILNQMKAHFARKVIKRWEELDAKILGKISDLAGERHFWQQGGGYDRNLVSQAEWFEKIQYIHENPVRAGLAVRAEVWNWSSASWYAGDHSGVLKIDPLWG